jgi:hypothetical protein
MRRSAIVVALVLGTTAPAFADVNIGIDLTESPPMESVPGSPVSYAPQVGANYFLYDGLYWVFDGNVWYSSSGYNGPWEMVPASDVPDAVLQVPISYYRDAPVYFRGWRDDGAPHWGEHWGSGWDQHRGDRHGDGGRGGQRGGGEHGGGEHGGGEHGGHGH